MPAGRPSDYSDETADYICDQIINGESLERICNPDIDVNAHYTIPHKNTVLRWLHARPDFAAKYARARELQADFMDHRILEVANSCTTETAQADKVKIGAYQWRAAKLAPKKYGDKQIVESTSEVTVQPKFDYGKLSRDERDVLRQLLLKSTPDK